MTKRWNEIIALSMATPQCGRMVHTTFIPAGLWFTGVRPPGIYGSDMTPYIEEAHSWMVKGRVGGIYVVILHSGGPWVMPILHHLHWSEAGVQCAWCLPPQATLLAWLYCPRDSAPRGKWWWFIEALDLHRWDFIAMLGGVVSLLMSDVQPSMCKPMNHCFMYVTHGICVV